MGTNSIPEPIVMMADLRSGLARASRLYPVYTIAAGITLVLCLSYGNRIIQIRFNRAKHDMRDLFIIIIAGLWGTLLMTGAMYLLFLVTRQNYKVVGILATMVTNHTTRDKGLTKSRSDLFIGILLHYLIGIIFSFIYYFLCESAVMELNIRSSMLFGMAAGIVAMIFWYCFIRMHPNPPLIPLYSYIIVVGLGHVIFGLGMYVVFMEACNSSAASVTYLSKILLHNHVD